MSNPFLSSFLSSLTFFSIIVFFLLVVGSQFLQEIFSGQWKTVFSIYQIFQAAETVSSKGNVFLKISSFRLMETDFCLEETTHSSVEGFKIRG